MRDTGVAVPILVGFLLGNQYQNANRSTTFPFNDFLEIAQDPRPSLKTIRTSLFFGGGGDKVY